MIKGSKQALSLEVVRVEDTNENIGLQVSWSDEWKLNIDENIPKCFNNSLFAFLGPAYFYIESWSPIIWVLFLGTSGGWMN